MAELVSRLARAARRLLFRTADADELLRIDIDIRRVLSESAALLGATRPSSAVSAATTRDPSAALVAVRTSEIAPSAGRGVFAARAIPAGAVLCFYPGRVMPPVPLAALPLDGDLPAGGLVPADLTPYAVDNAYILNLEDGGSVDAAHCASDSDQVDGAVGMSATTIESHRPLPFLARCAHLVNHCSGRSPNCTSISFAWADVLAHLPAQAPRHALPNQFDAGAVWYVDTHPNAALVHGASGGGGHSSGAQSSPGGGNANERGNVVVDGGAVVVRVPAPPAGASPRAAEDDEVVRRLPGIAFVALRDLRAGEELLLDYALRGPPYPQWARDWYRPRARR